jgi:hypothetical protein
MTKIKPTEPDATDFAWVEREYGCLPENAPDEACAHYYPLAQVAKLIRLHSECATIAELEAAVTKRRR